MPGLDLRLVFVVSFAIALPLAVAGFIGLLV